MVYQEPVCHSGRTDIGARDAGVLARQIYRPNTYSNIDYKQLLREINASEHLPETKIEMVIELVGMLQEFKSQAYKEKADSVAEIQQKSIDGQHSIEIEQIPGSNRYFIPMIS